MNYKLARELCRRGLDATSVKQLGLANKGTKDGALFKALANLAPCVLVAWDSKMALSHRSELDHFGITLAVVDRYANRGGLNDEQYYRDVIHRHAHRMGTQLAGSLFKYNRTRRSDLRYALHDG
jgi:hypothetical protein